MQTLSAILVTLTALGCHMLKRLLLKLGDHFPAQIRLNVDAAKLDRGD
jgi:hypothetical protein